MKNNAIMFMIDSVTWNAIENNRCKISPTPFLDSLKKEGLWTTKLYSQGPYTDAATRGLYTGRNVLDDFGYFFKLNTSPITHYRAFKNEGYETIGYYYPYYMMGANVIKDIDKLYYKTGFEFGSEWGGIFKYYSDIRSQRPLNSIEVLMVEKRLELLFEVWQDFYERLITQGNTTKNLNDILEYSDIQKVRSIIIEEYDKYSSNKEMYIDDMLAKGLEHVLANINDISIDHRISRDFLNKTHIRNRSFFRKVTFNNFVANLFKTMPSPRRVAHALSRYLKTRDKSEFLFFENYFLGLIPYQIVKSRWGLKRWQNMPSTRFQLDFVQTEILPNRSKDKPFFLCLNIEEAHNNLSFFTYDVEDEKLVDEEINMLHDFVSKLGTGFKGNLIYYLGLRYMDWCIEKFCTKLMEMGLWENTSLLFTADHGSSYTFYPVHNNRVNNFYDECYHIPMLIRHPGLVPKEVTSYQYSKDILPTFLDVMGLELSKHFKGRSMLRELEPRKYVVHEYMGPGCPDIMQRPIWFSARDDNYLVAYKVSINEDWNDGILCEVYNLKDDPQCYYNIVGSIDTNLIDYLLIAIRDRYLEIRSTTKHYYDLLLKSESAIPISE